MTNKISYNVKYIEFISILLYIEGGNIDPYYFSDDLQNILNFIEDYKDKHNVFPTVDYIEQLCNFTAPEDLLKEEYINEELKNLWLTRQIQNKLSILVSESAENPVKSLEDISDLCFSLRRDLELEDNTTILFSDIDQRITDYLDPNKRPIIKTRCTWGLPIIDYNTKGLCDGDLAFIVAATNQGKSWVSKRVALHAVIDEGKKVVLLPFEESSEEAISRIDSIFGGVSSTKYMEKLLDTSEIKTLTDKVTSWKLSQGSKGELWIPDVRKIKRGSTRDIVKLIKSYDADLIIIDQLTLLSKSLDWQDMSNLVKELKTVAMMMERPILCLTQVKNNYKEPIEKAELSCVALAEEISRNADSVLYIGNHRDTDQAGTKFFKLMKTRRGSQLLTRNKWELNFSTIEELGEYIPSTNSKSTKSNNVQSQSTQQSNQDFTTVWRSNR